MASKNIIKIYAENQFYHVYNRGVDKNLIFNDDSDKTYFLKILERYLGPNSYTCDKKSYTYPNYYNEIDLLSFCLMDNHFHLLFWQKTKPRALPNVMKSISTSYSMYFNKKYVRSGPLFQGNYKALMITNNSHLSHISRYIHLNPHNFNTYKYSSYKTYLGSESHCWLKPQRILDIFQNENYKIFVESLKNDRPKLEGVDN